MKRVLACLVFFSLATGLAKAAIIDLGTITRDTSSGLEWLDVTESMNLSYNQVVSELGTGGLFAGWRYATSDEIIDLMTEFGISSFPQSLASALPAAEVGFASQFIQLLGNTIEPGSTSFGGIGILGIREPVDYSGGNTYVLVSGLLIPDDGSGSGPSISVGVPGLSPDTNPSNAGSFLVREFTPVPVPFSAVFFLSSLVSLVAMGLKKR